MQKSGIKFLRILPRTIVPLDSAVIFVLYAIYYTAYSHFRQYVFYIMYLRGNLYSNIIVFNDAGTFSHMRYCDCMCK